MARTFGILPQGCGMQALAATQRRAAFFCHHNTRFTLEVIRGHLRHMQTNETGREEKNTGVDTHCYLRFENI